MKFFRKKLAVLLLSIICVISLAGVISGCSSCAGCKKGNPVEADNATTVRKVRPEDGTTPMDHTAIENIGYMAYVLDNQPFYHAYAYNSTKSTGYEQKTQTWKDYKSAEESGINASVMIASDLSYSMFVKSATQSCFVGGEDAFMRGGSKPSQSSVATSLEWNLVQPDYYTKEDYLKTYGEFSTEISVYVINEETVSSADEVIDNGDGTYTQKFYLKNEAVCWYQYGMKTRGSLKSFPEFESIEIEFTFDKDWQVISSYCEEKATIKPGAMAGIPMKSTAKTTTEYDYTEAGFDNVHYGYFDDFFKKYVNEKPDTSGGNTSGVQEPALLDVLGGGFSNVVSESGQQFDISLTVGETNYDGKIYLKLTDMSDIMGSLDARFTLEKAGSGRQDFYAEFSGGALNVYYSDGFAMTADINEVTAAVNNLIELINSFGGDGDGGDGDTEGGETGGSSIDLQDLLSAIDFSYDDLYVTLSINSSDLLGLGVGVDVVLNFWRIIDEDGFNVYEFADASLNSITYSGTAIGLKASITPDSGSKIISHNKSDAPLDLADFIGSVYELLSSNSFVITLGLDGSAQLDYINGIVLDAAAYVQPDNSFKSISASVDMDVTVLSLNAVINAYYVIDTQNGGYGDIYLTLKKINGVDVDVKVYCNIKDVVETVTSLIGSVNAVSDGAEVNAEQANSVATVVNKVLALNFGAIIKELKASEDKLNLSLDADEILSSLGIDLGINFGTVSLGLEKGADGKAELSGAVSGLGLALGINGSADNVAAPDPNDYLDLLVYINGALDLLDSESYKIIIGLDGAALGIDGLTVNAPVSVAFGEDYKSVSVNAAVSADYITNETSLSVELEVYYELAFNGISNGNYGDVYLNLKSVTVDGELTHLGAKVCCNVTELYETIKTLIGTVTAANESGVSAQADAVSSTVADILSLDFAAIIKSATADGTGINLTVNVDEILGAFVDIDVELGELTLVLTTGNNGVTLSGSLEKLGLTLDLSGSSEKVTAPDASEYADLTVLLDGALKLINSEAYKVVLSLDGSQSGVGELSGVKADITAYAALENNTVKVSADVTASYEDEDLIAVGVKLSVYYTISLDGNGYGNAYIDITEITVNGDKIENLSVKVYADISGAADAVTQIVNSVKGIVNSVKSELQAPATTYGAEEYVRYVTLVEQIKTSTTALDVSFDVDGLIEMLGLGEKVGNIQFGSLALSFDNSNKPELTGKLAKLGLSLSLTGSDIKLTAPELNEYANLNDYLDAINTFVNGESYLLNLTLGGRQITIPASGEGKDTVIDLGGLNVTAPVKVSFGADYRTASVSAEVTLDYVTNETSFGAELEVYYELAFNGVSNGNYGDIYLNLKSVTLGGETTALGAKVCCNISELYESIKTLISLINGESGENGLSAQAEDTVTGVLANVLSIDFASVIKTATADGTGINLTVNVDEILGSFVNLNGFELGELTLALNVGNNGLTLGGSLDKLGLSLDMSGCDEKVTAPEDINNYLNLNELTDIIISAYNEAQAIIGSQDIEFNIDGTLTVDGIAINVKGSGEVVWNDNGLVSVAVKLTLSVTDDGKTDTVDVNFVYDGNAQISEPFVKLTVGTLGLNITKNDIDGITDGIDGLKNAVAKLGETFGKAETQTAGGADSAENGEEQIALLSEEAEDAIDFTAIINKVLAELNKFGITLVDGKPAGNGALKYILISHSNGSLKLSSNGGLALDLVIGDVLALEAAVKAPEYDEVNGYAIGNYTRKLVDELATGYEFYGSDEDGKFIKAVYEYLFDVIEQLSIKEILGSDTYTVSLELNGAESGISALEGVAVKGELYYTEGLNGTVIGTKLVEADLDITVNGTVIQLNAQYAGQTVYVEIKNVAGTQLIGTDSVNGIKIKADVHDVYEIAETLVNFLSGLKFPENGSAEAEGEDAISALSDSEVIEEKNAITSLLSSVLSLNLNSIISRDKVDGENIYTIKPDSILSIFNVNISVGTAVITVNPKTHALGAAVTADGKDGAWLKFNANVLDASDITRNTLNPDDYLDIGFAKTLIGDITDAMVDEDGELQLLYSFSGKITASLTYKLKVGLISTNITSEIVFDSTVLTAGLDKNGDLYLSVEAQLQNAPVKALGVSVGNVATAGKISITYSNGYITLGRGDQYKVMTMEYLLDNLTGGEELLKWLLGTGDTLWSAISGQLPAISSGLTNTQEMYLYDVKQASADNSKFYLSSILSGYQAMIDGKEAAAYGTADAAATALGLTDNYYAFDINANSLTNGTIRSLYAAILRNGKDVEGNAVKGVSGLKASLNVMNLLSVTVNLDNRTYDHVTDYYLTALGGRTEEELGFGYSNKISAHETQVFGCYDTKNGVSYSTILDEVMIRLLDENGNVMTDRDGNEAEYEITYGSTVYLDSLWSPFWSSEEGYENYTLTYGDKDGNPLGGTPVYAADGTTVIGTYITLNDDSKLDYYIDEDGKTVYTITVRRITDKSTERKAITYHTGVDGVDEITAALALNADGTVNLLDYEISGYVLVAIYEDKEHNIQLSADDKRAFKGSEVYCLYLVDTYEEDGVIYKLHSDNTDCFNCENTVHYHVNTYNKDAILAYTEDGSVLFIKNEIEINGITYPVTAIDANAFAYMGNSPEATDTTPGIGAGLKNVVVPENIKYVGALAFADNQNIKSVVFLADTVTFGGYDKNAPFYGCTETSGGELTNLSVYYNKAVSGGSNGDNGAPAWAYTRQPSNNKHRYIGHNGGTLGSELSGAERYEYSKNDGDDRRYTAGYAPMWSYAQFSFVGVNITNTVNLEELNISELTDGIIYAAYTAEYIETCVMNRLNEMTSVNGYINAFEVTVSCGVVYGKFSAVTVTVTEKTSDEWYYALSVISSVPDCTASYTVDEQYKAEFNGATYVLAGAQITLESEADEYGVYKFEYWEVNGEQFNDVTLAMPEVSTSIKAFWYAPNGISTITVISEIEFTYHHKAPDVVDGKYVFEAANTMVLSDPEQVVGENGIKYDFLGWATANGTSLIKYTSAIECDIELYALWVEAKDNVTFSLDENATVSVTANEGTVYGWYKYDEDGYSTEVSNTLTTSVTVIKARMQYTLSINFKGSNTGVRQTSDTAISCLQNNNNVNLTANTETVVVEKTASVDITLVYVILEDNELSLYIDPNTLNLMDLTVSDQYKITYEVSKWSKNLFGSWSESKNDADRRFNDKDSHSITVNGTTLALGSGNIYNSGALNKNVSISIGL